MVIGKAKSLNVGDCVNVFNRDTGSGVIPALIVDKRVRKTRHNEYGRLTLGNDVAFFKVIMNGERQIILHGDICNPDSFGEVSINDVNTNIIDGDEDVNISDVDGEI